MKLQITNDIIAEAYSKESGDNPCTRCLIATAVREIVKDDVDVRCGSLHVSLNSPHGNTQIIWVGDGVRALINSWTIGERVVPQEIEIDIADRFLREDTGIDLPQPPVTQQVDRTEALAHAK